MSYEAEMLLRLKMPSKKEVQEALLIALFRHNGTIKEFGAGQEIVDEIAGYFNLTDEQRAAQLETIYRKENRIKKSSLWHRLLFRAADELARNQFVLRPSETFRLSQQKEWMLTEKGYDLALSLLHIPETAKENLFIRSYEVELAAKEIIHKKRPDKYVPVEQKRTVITTREISIRSRGFRQAVIQAYDYSCALCGLKLNSPDGKIWEAQAAHIVPHSVNGKDDILNGISLCRLHHWAFDTGWFSIENDYSVILSKRWDMLPQNFGRMRNLPVFNESSKIILPSDSNAYPHASALEWHRENIFTRNF